MIIESYLLNKSLFRVQIGLKGEDPLKYSNLKENLFQVKLS